MVWSIGTAQCTDRLSEYPPRRAIETRPRITHHTPRPLVHNLHQTGLELLPKLLELDITLELLRLDLVRDAVDHFEAVGELRRDLGLRIRLFDKDKDGEERDDLLWGVRG